jgi:hypothetical protein
LPCWIRRGIVIKLQLYSFIVVFPRKTNIKLLIYSKLIMGCRQRLQKRYYAYNNPFSRAYKLFTSLKYFFLLFFSHSSFRIYLKVLCLDGNLSCVHLKNVTSFNGVANWVLGTSLIPYSSHGKVDARFTIYTKSTGSYKRINAK